MSFWQRFLKDKLAVSGLIVVLAFFVLAALAPLLAPQAPDAIDVGATLLPPSAQHLCGTDELGRDVFSRLLYGARISLEVGFVAVGLATLIGVMLGALAGYFGGLVDAAIMRLTDIMLCFPSFFLILAVVALLEPSIFNIMAVIGLTSWMGVAPDFQAALKAGMASSWPISPRACKTEAAPVSVMAVAFSSANKAWDAF